MADPLDETSRFQELLGYSLTVWTDGEARIEQPILPQLGNRSGIPHGGVYATLIDTAMGYTGCWTPPKAPRQFALTLSLTVNYLGQPKGERLICTANKTGGGRTIFYAEAQLLDDLGNAIATGTGVFKLIKPAVS